MHACVLEQVAGGVNVPDVFGGIADSTALNKLINDAVSGVALAGGVDMTAAFDVLDSGVSTKDALDVLSSRMGPICDGAVDGLASLLAAQSTTPAAFDLQVRMRVCAPRPLVVLTRIRKLSRAARSTSRSRGAATPGCAVAASSTRASARPLSGALGSRVCAADSAHTRRA